MKLPALSMAIVLLVGPAVAVAVADDLEDAIQSLKDAAAKKDVDAIKKLVATILPSRGTKPAILCPNLTKNNCARTRGRAQGSLQSLQSLQPPQPPHASLEPRGSSRYGHHENVAAPHDGKNQ